MNIDRKAYNKEYRKENVGITSYWKRNWAERLRKLAKKYNVSVSTLINQLVDAYLNQNFLCDFNQELIDLIRILRGVATNINQVATKVNSTGVFSKAELQGLIESVRRMEEFIKQKLQEPLNVITWLEKKIEENPKLLEQLELLIQKIRLNRDR